MLKDWQRLKKTLEIPSKSDSLMTDMSCDLSSLSHGVISDRVYDWDQNLSS